MALLSCPTSDRNSVRAESVARYYQTERSSVTEVAMLGGEASTVTNELRHSL